MGDFDSVDLFTGRIEDKEVPEANIAGITDFHRAGEWHKTTDYTVEKSVCELDIAGMVDFQRQRLGAFFPLLFKLQSVESPVRGVADDHFIAHVMLDGHGVNPAAG